MMIMMMMIMMMMMMMMMIMMTTARQASADPASLSATNPVAGCRLHIFKTLVNLTLHIRSFRLTQKRIVFRAAVPLRSELYSAVIALRNYFIKLCKWFHKKRNFGGTPAS
jgi:hypothetical protein